jgi:two-component system, NarL family, nitrate/nitrite response regulator NarL
MTAVFVIEPCQLYRTALAEFLERNGYRVVGKGAELSEVAKRSPDPEIVLAASDSLHDVDKVRRVLAERTDLKILGVGFDEDQDALMACAEAGVEGFLTRDCSTDELLDALANLEHGDASLPPAAARMLLRGVAMRAQAAAHHPDSRLTSREREVGELIGGGLSNKEIAERLCISLPTVKNHVHNMLEKLQVGRRSDIAAMIRSEPGSRI